MQQTMQQDRQHLRQDLQQSMQNAMSALQTNAQPQLTDQQLARATYAELSTHILRKNISSPEKDQWRQARARAWISGTN
jgi:hypothetical protein